MPAAPHKIPPTIIAIMMTSVFIFKRFPTANGNIDLSILTSTLGNHVRNIKILKLQDEYADLENDPFYSEFKEKTSLEMMH